MRQFHSLEQKPSLLEKGLSLAKRWPVSGGLAVLLALSGGWFIFLRDKNEPTQVPLIKADPRPLKYRPENAGEPDVPHQEKQVYDQLAQNTPPRVERLLPEEEKPMELASEESKVVALPDEEVALSHSDFNDLEEIDVVLADEGEMKKVDADTGKILENKDSPSVESQAPTVLAKNEPKETKRESQPGSLQLAQTVRPSVSLAKPQFRVQIASLPSPVAAKREWGRLSGQYGALLKGYQAHFMRVDLGKPKGVVYRVQVGQFATKEQAAQLCKSLNQANPRLGCMVVPYR